MIQNDIVCFESTQLEVASETVAKAFHNDPMFSYLSPVKDELRFNAIHWLSRRMISYCAHYRHVYTTQKVDGIAAWLPPEQSTLGISQILPMMVQLHLHHLPWYFGWDRLGRWLKVFGAIAQAHDQEMGNQPHWYLAILTVHPEVQGRGVGGQLLQPMLTQASQDRLPCYLVTFSEPAMRFYQKHGFTIMTRQAVVPGAPLFWTMGRNP